ncbi:MAG: hypothetical protein Q7T34_02025 [Candidatus Parcubacteria bacterium]|nr:hypothetical protein [Candidatus Parcubacteria bacterium]
MINLLPPQFKEELKMEESYRMTLILGILITLFFVSLGLVLLSVNLYLTGQVESQQISIQAADREIKTPEAIATEEKIISLNKTVSGLNSFYQKQIKASASLEEIAGILPEGSYATQISFTPNPEGKDYNFKVSFSGFAETRQILFQLKQNIENNGDFSDLYFPPSNWVEPNDVNFTLTFFIK